MNRTEERRLQMKKQGERLKKEIKALADRLDKKGRLKLKIALMESDASETAARLLINGDYRYSPRKDLIETIEGVLTSFGKAKAS